jgi:hypothetical protein
MYQKKAIVQWQKKLKLKHLGRGIWANIISINPKLAADLLAGNLDNRSIKKNNLLAITNDMKGGAWTVNGAAIVIGKDGRLIDGQHRLQAVIDSGKTIYSLVQGGPRDAANGTRRAGH